MYIARQKDVSQVSSFQVVEEQSRDTKLVKKVGRTWTDLHMSECHKMSTHIDTVHTGAPLARASVSFIWERCLLVKPWCQQVGYFHAKKEISLLIRVPRSSMTFARSFCFIGVLRFEFFKLIGLFWRMNFEELLSPCHPSNSWLRLEKGDDYPQSCVSKKQESWKRHPFFQAKSTHSATPLFSRFCLKRQQKKQVLLRLGCLGWKFKDLFFRSVGGL